MSCFIIVVIINPLSVSHNESPEAFLTNSVDTDQTAPIGAV